MRLIRSAVLYAALALSANLMPATGRAATLDMGALRALRAGSMLKMQFHGTPRPVPQVAFEDAKGKSHTLDEYRGKYVLVNFWATWCVPCRTEMPTLDGLQAKLGGDKFQVVPIGTLRTTLPGVHRFFGQEKITHLPVRLDPHSKFAREMRIMALPISVILDPQGREIARIIGEADWTSPSAVAIVRYLIDKG